METAFVPNSTAQTQKNSRLVWIMFAVVLVILAAIFYGYLFFFRQRLSGVKTDFFTVNDTTGEFTKTEQPPQANIITDLDFSRKQEPVVSMGRVLKGYFEEYNPTTNTLKLKNQLVQSKVLQLLEVQTGGLAAFACWNEVFQQGETVRPIKDLEFYVEPDGRDIVMPGERILPIDQLSAFLRPEQYMIIQLTSEFDIRKTNSVQKLMLVGC